MKTDNQWSETFVYMATMRQKFTGETAFPLPPAPASENAVSALETEFGSVKFGTTYREFLTKYHDGFPEIDGLLTLLSVDQISRNEQVDRLKAFLSGDSGSEADEYRSSIGMDTTKLVLVGSTNNYLLVVQPNADGSSDEVFGLWSGGCDKYHSFLDFMVKESEL